MVFLKAHILFSSPSEVTIGHDEVLYRKNKGRVTQRFDPAAESIKRCESRTQAAGVGWAHAGGCLWVVDGRGTLSLPFKMKFSHCAGGWGGVVECKRLWCYGAVVINRP